MDLLDALGLREVMVIGSSIGGWIAAEMALRDTRSVLTCAVLANAAGIQGDPGQEITDLSGLGPAEIGALAFHQPRFRPDPAALSDEQRAAAAADQRTLAVYAGRGMYDPKLRGRLHRVQVPVLVLWGEHDGVIPPAYGRTYAAALPNATFAPIAESGHFPFMENPAATFAALGEFVETRVGPIRAAG